MARKPVHLMANAPRPEGRQVMWEAMRKLRRFRLSDIEDQTRILEKTVQTYVKGLTRAGYLKRIEAPEPPADTRYPPHWWELVNDVGVEAPRVTQDGKPVTQGRGREQMWRTMRIIGSFNWRELAVQASTEDHPVKPGEAKDYVHHLYKAGYLGCVQAGGPGQAARYRLFPSRYTGPLPPMVQRIKQVFDPNVGRVVWPKEDDHE
ncbi:hypothetical protein [Marinobacter subterrani]|uniref:Uncharacterized protein n=1 Tax=Marinobacter subterrani TaxID=1658765 RepID=A0A0J7J656_9GAMM|nr:hypothetical protein [Marinobacter subterrani]KMQ74033.1 hypothetical protein Msub_10204 [Marinobacter subterrani]